MKDFFQLRNRVGKTSILHTILGGVAASVGLELFLHPHELIAGGVTGISGLVSFHTENHFGILLLLFNLPLLLLYSFLGSRPVLRRVLPGLFAFSGSAFLLAPLPAISGEPVTAALAGGICLGFGAGLAAKSGGLLDSLGLEEPGHVRPSAIILSNQHISVEGMLLLCQGIVLIAAGLTIGWERTLYSALACLAAYETARLMLMGIRRSVRVVTMNREEVMEALRSRIRLEAEGPSESSQDEINTLEFKVHLFDIPRFKAVIHQADPDAKLIYVNRNS